MTPRTSINPPADPPAARLLRRAPHEGRLGGIEVPGGSLRALLEADPARLDKSTMRLGQIAESLPLGTLTAAERRSYSQRGGSGVPALVAHTVNGLRLAPQIEQAAGIPAARLRMLGSRQGRFRFFQTLGERMKNSGMNARLVVGAFQFTLIGQVLDDLEARLADPQTPRCEREALLRDFGPGLLLVEEVLQGPVKGRAARGAARAGLEAELQERQAQAALDGVILAVRSGEPVPRQALADAARHHQGTGHAADAPPAKGRGRKGSGPRIIR